MSIDDLRYPIEQHIRRCGSFDALRTDRLKRRRVRNERQEPRCEVSDEFPRPFLGKSLPRHAHGEAPECTHETYRLRTNCLSGSPIQDGTPLDDMRRPTSLVSPPWI